VDRLLRHFAQEVFERQQTGCAAKDIVTDLRLDVDHELFEHGERLGLVFDERVTLAVSPQANAVAQAVHVVKMLLPQFIDRAQNGVTLDRLQGLGVFKAHFQFVGLADAVGDKVANSELRRA